MKWNVYTIIQLLCWSTGMIVLICSMLYPEFFGEKPDTYLKLLAGFSGAAIAIGEFKEQRSKKFSAANVLAIGYIRNFIEPVMDEQFKQFHTQGKSFTVKRMYIFIPEKINDINSSTMNALLSKAGIVCRNVSVPVSMKNRSTMDIREMQHEETHTNYYFDAPNTISSLKALIDYTLGKKGNTASDEKKEALERKYLFIFREETERLLHEMKLDNYVKVINKVEDME